MSTHGIERRHLLALVALAEHHAFVKAADSLFVTPSTLAASVRQVERMVGATLVERTRTGSGLNERGLVVAAAAAKALREMDAVVEQARSASTVESGSLIALTTPTLAETVAARLVRSLRSRSPGLRISIGAPRRPIVADVAYAVAAGEVDFGMTEAMGRPVDGLVTVPLGRTQIAYAFPRGARERPRSVELRHLAKYGLVVVPHFESSTVYSELRSRSPEVDGWVRARVAARHAFVDLADAGVAGFLCQYPVTGVLRTRDLYVAPFKRPFTREFVTLARSDDRRMAIALVLGLSREQAASAIHHAASI